MRGGLVGPLDLLRAYTRICMYMYTWTDRGKLVAPVFANKAERRREKGRVACMKSTVSTGGVLAPATT